MIVGPDYFTWDFSTFKLFPIHEQTHLEFRGEFFNFTNHPNFALPNNVVGDTNLARSLRLIATPGIFSSRCGSSSDHPVMESV